MEKVFFSFLNCRIGWTVVVLLAILWFRHGNVNMAAMSTVASYKSKNCRMSLPWLLANPTTYGSNGYCELFFAAHVQLHLKFRPFQPSFSQQSSVIFVHFAYSYFSFANFYFTFVFLTNEKTCKMHKTCIIEINNLLRFCAI